MNIASSVWQLFNDPRPLAFQEDASKLDAALDILGETLGELDGEGEIGRRSTPEGVPPDRTVVVE